MRIDPCTFEPRYADHAQHDPWGFRHATYEQRRYDHTIGMLGRPRYRRAFEPACAVGELTTRLAPRCEELVAMDPSATALREATWATAAQPLVQLLLGAIPEDWPPGGFDLIVLSEVGYYFEVPELEQILERCQRSLTADGELLAVHWRGRSEDHLLHADEVHRTIATSLGRDPDVERHDPGFLCARWDAA